MKWKAKINQIEGEAESSEKNPVLSAKKGIKLSNTGKDIGKGR